MTATEKPVPIRATLARDASGWWIEVDHLFPQDAGLWRMGHTHGPYQKRPSDHLVAGAVDRATGKCWLCSSSKGV